MAIYFEGTSTKERYEVGREYLNSRGQVVTANSDGSFGNRETGQVSRGSSYNPDVAWFADGADGSRWGEYHNQPTGFAFRTDQGKEIYTRPDPGSPSGASRASSPGLAAGAFNGGLSPITGPRVSMANRGAFLRDMAWSGKAEPSQDLMIGGFHWLSNPRTINADMVEVRYGDSELISTFFGLAALGSDIGYNARHYANLNGWNDGRGALDAAVRSVEPTSLVDTFMSFKDAANEWSAKENAAYERKQAAQEDLNDAWDYRMQMQEAEDRKRIDATLDPNNYKVQDRLTPNVWGY